MRNERSIDCDRSAVTLCGLGFEAGLHTAVCTRVGTLIVATIKVPTLVHLHGLNNKLYKMHGIYIKIEGPRIEYI